MRKIILLLYLTLGLCYFVSAQMKTYTNDIKDTVTNVYSLKGIETNLESSIYGRSATGFAFPLYLGYFNEFRLTSVSTMILSFGANITPSTYLTDSAELRTGEYSSYIVDTMRVYSCRFSAKAGIEPRWYWTFKKRTLSGKTRLNSGWFLSFPIQAIIPMPFNLRTPALNITPPPIKSKWIEEYFNMYTSCGLSVGFRQALCKNWLIEGSAGLQVNGLFYFRKDIDDYIDTSVAPQLKITAAYVFN